MNEQIAEQTIKRAYRTIRIVRAIRAGHRSPALIAEMTNAPLNLIHHYLIRLEVEPNNNSPIYEERDE